VDAENAHRLIRNSLRCIFTIALFVLTTVVVAGIAEGYNAPAPVSDNTPPAASGASTDHDASAPIASPRSFTQVSGSGTVTVSSVTPSGQGTSSIFTNTAAGTSELRAVFRLNSTGHVSLQPPKSKTSFDFQLKRALGTPLVGTAIKITLDDGAGGHSAEFDVAGGQMPTDTNWYQFGPSGSFLPIPIPASGAGGWGTGTGWDFGVDSVVNLTINCSLLQNDSYYFDISFTGN
jgi:hypothetical protein